MHLPSHEYQMTFCRERNLLQVLNDFFFERYEPQNLKKLAERFQVITHFQPGHPWPETLTNSFTALVQCHQSELDKEF